MFKYFKKKTLNLIKTLPVAFKAYLPHIVFLVFTFQLLVFFGTLPYINIIGKYYYYVFGLLWIFSNFLFKQYLTNKKILIFGILMFFLAIPVAILDLNSFADAIGFAAFLLLITYILRQIFIDRSSLK
jgi:hypothetical protein